MSRYLPHLRALGQRETEWDPHFMDRRADVLLRLAYARLKDWIGLELSDSSTDPVVHVGDEVDPEDEEIDDENASLDRPTGDYVATSPEISAEVDDSAL